MRLRILGASGGIGAGARTTSFLLGRDVLIDAGTGVADLSLAELAAIDHVVLTHSHLDHITALPFLLDAVGTSRSRPVTVHAQSETLEVLKAHIFNNAVWPDFARIPSAERPFLRYEVFAAGEERVLGGCRVRSIPVTHVVPAVGFLLQGPTGSLAFSGDTASTEEFWRVLNACADLRHLIVETSFVDAEQEIARLARHFCPATVVAELRKLKRRPTIHITHLMPGEEKDILREIAQHDPQLQVQPLLPGAVIEF
jgi:ribonuclease BN (tRNA processing enzyme)